MQPTSWKKDRRNWGHLSTHPGSTWNSSRATLLPSTSTPLYKRWLRRLGMQIVFVFILSVLTFWIYHARSPILKSASTWLVQSLHQDTDFSAVQAWYQENIGPIPLFPPLLEEFKGGGVVSVMAPKSPSSFAEVAGLGQGKKEAVSASQQEIGWISLPVGKEIRVTRPGKVLSIISIPKVGYRMMIQHEGGWATCLEGLQEVHVSVRDSIQAGQSLGKGNQAASSAWYQGQIASPAGWFSFG